MKKNSKAKAMRIQKDDGHAEEDDEGIHPVEHEHRRHTQQRPKRGCVVGEVLERGPEVRRGGAVEKKTGKVGDAVREEEEVGGDRRHSIDVPEKQTQLRRKKSKRREAGRERKQDHRQMMLHKTDYNSKRKHQKIFKNKVSVERI